MKLVSTSVFALIAFPVLAVTAQEHSVADQNNKTPAIEASGTASGPNECCGYEPGPEGTTTDFLLETCSVPGQTAYGMIPNFDCQSYILAVVDTLQSVQERHTPVACPPQTITAGHILELLWSRFSSETDGSRRASDVIIEALVSVYPCSP
jgi:hypothetical protein